jgi:antitoxin CcdA
LQKLVAIPGHGLAFTTNASSGNIAELPDIRHGLNETGGLDYAYKFMRMDNTMPTARVDRTDQSTKRATNLSLSRDVLAAAKALGINISAVCDAHLREVVLLEQQRRWRSDYAKFIGAYNETVEAEGLPLEQWRNF